MHKTEGADNVAGLFADGPPGTVVEDDWLNAVQNEIRNYIEGAGLTLKTAGTETGNQLLAAHIAYGAASNIVTYTSGVNNYSKPAGLAFVKVTVTGGGGGGGGVAGGGAGTYAGAGGGSGAGTAIKIIPASTLLATTTATVGAGGSGGAAGNNHGAPGSLSTFGTHCQGNGGDYGRGMNSISDTRTGYELRGGSSSGGNINIRGGCSIKQIALQVNIAGAISGGGGSSFFGGGAPGARSESGASGLAGLHATQGGGGGGGVCNATATDYAGGDGGDGIIVIEEYF